MDMFEEIYEIKKDLPKFSSVFDSIKNKDYNAFQVITIFIGIMLFLTGIVLGNIFPACGASLTFYSDACETTEFNILLMITVWFASFILCLFLYGLGEIIRLLNEIVVKK